MKPLIGISCCVKGFGIFNTPNHAASDSYVRVVLGPVGGVPVLLPAAGEILAAEMLPRLEAEGWAPDGTVEAVRVKDAPGYAYGVQWHPEYDWQQDPVSRRIFESFGEACAAWAAGRSVAPLAQAAE